MPEELALLGGKPAVPREMIKPWPHVTKEDLEAVAAVLEAMGSSGGPGQSNQQRAQAEGLAREWAEYVGVKHCIPVNSGTAALHLCVAGLGIGPGDEVILPAFTFWASAAAVLHQNAIPVFVDIEPRTFCINPDLIEDAITPHTKAIMAVHIHGMPADVDPIIAIAKRRGLGVIEDGAQAHGARYKGRVVGSLGDAAGFSTQASKPLSSGCQGGLFVTDDDEIHRRAAQAHYFGELVTPGREREEQEYNAHGLGWMYRGDMLAQAFVRSQLKRLDHYNSLRIRNCQFLTEHLRDVPGIETPFVPDDREPVYYNYVVGFRPEELGLDVPARVLRDKAMEALRAEGAQVGLWQRKSVPAQDVFQKLIGYGGGCPWRCHKREVDYDLARFPVANAFLDSHLYVYNINPPNGLDLMALYVEAFRKVMTNIEKLVKA